MEYQKFEHTLIVRLDRGEEIVDCLLDLARREHITLASVNGLGAVNQVTAGVFSPVTSSTGPTNFRETLKSSACTALSPPRTAGPTATSTSASATTRAGSGAGI